MTPGIPARLISDLAPVASAAPRSVAVLGSTGSIGQTTLKLIEHSSNKFTIRALTAFDNVALLAEQAQRWRPEFVAIGNPKHYEALKAALSGTGIRCGAGENALIEAAGLDSDIVMAAIVGAAGLPATLAAIRRGGAVALANKECLVCAGALMMQEARAHGATLLPVDSEHNAIFQLFDFAAPEMVESITLTASGGPFRTASLEAMRAATPEAAVKHPNWSMGAKISVDSATLMNKGLELIEAAHLFPVQPSQIQIVVHPESVVHGLVTYRDGSVLAAMGVPDMSLPIAHALAWPKRMEAPTRRLDLARLGKLTFEAPDETRFPALKLARRALEQGGTVPAQLNAANEIAVSGFLMRKIGFLDIMRVVEQTLGDLAPSSATHLQEVMVADTEARQRAKEILDALAD